MSFFARSQFILDNAQPVIDAVCNHLVDHGIGIEKADHRTVLTSVYGSCEVLVEGNRVALVATAPTLTGIAVIREQLAGHLIEHSPELDDKIVWSGDGSDQTYPVWFCLLTVVETRAITPHMQRIRFSGSDLDRYGGFGDIHMRLMFPRGGDTAPQWPSVGANGVTHYPDAETLAIRKYTIRSIDVASGTLDVDFVLHDDAGPGSDFAARGRPGDVIGMGGPGGRSAPIDRDWYLLAGDETALPAIARILETLPHTAKGVALIEVAEKADQHSIETRSGIAIHWLHRGARMAGTTDLLTDAVRGTAFPGDGATLFCWVGCEHQTCLAIKTHLRKERGLNKQDDLLVSYWRKPSPA